jgi:hypothetical protein
MSASTTSPAGIPSPTDPVVASAVATWAARRDRVEPAAILSAVVALVARSLDVEVDFVFDGRTVSPDPQTLADPVDDGVLDVGPWLPGFVREAMLSDAQRSGEGAHHTSPEVAAAVVAVAGDVRPWRAGDVVLDPAVGGGAFLLAVADALPGTPGERVGLLRGCDIDPLAVATARAALQLWSGGEALGPDAIRVADGLLETWHEPIDAVIGNPPFLSQLRDGTARDDSRRASLRDRWPSVGGYVDDALLFLLAAADTVQTDGVVAMIQPASVLGARDGGAVRARLEEIAPPAAVWLDGGQRFAASVDTVALVLTPGREAAVVSRSVGVPPAPLPDALPEAGSWTPLLLTSAPVLDRAALATAGEVGDIAAVTAGFRDQYYGLRDAVHEDPSAALRLMTSGLIDPLSDRWGRVDCRFDRRAWRHPGVDLDQVDPSIQGWIEARLVPKLLLASQTKTIEAVVDTTGTMVPCTPVVSVEPNAAGAGLAHLAVVLTSPITTALLLRQAAGTALSSDAMRVTARSIASLPLPGNQAAWDAAAALVERRLASPDSVSVIEIGRASMAAYGVAERSDLHNWWQSRLPAR